MDTARTLSYFDQRLVINFCLRLCEGVARSNHLSKLSSDVASWIGFAVCIAFAYKLYMLMVNTLVGVMKEF